MINLKDQVELIFDFPNDAPNDYCNYPANKKNL